MKRFGFLIVISMASTLFVGPNALGAATVQRVDIGDVSALEGTSATRGVRIAVTLSDPSSTDVRVAYSTSNQSAIGGTDFNAASGTVVIPGGQTTAFINLTLRSDSTLEGTETFAVTLSAPSSGVALGRSVGTVSILDDDASTARSVNVGDAAVVEGDTGTPTVLQFPLTLSRVALQNTTVKYALASQSALVNGDFKPLSGTVTFLPGQHTKFVSVQVVRDHVGESQESFGISLSAPVNASLGRSAGTGTILNDDMFSTNTVLTSSTNPAPFVSTVRLIATVSAVVGPPTGDVKFYDGALLLATVALIDGAATFDTSSLSLGAHTLKAVYGGSVTHLGSTSPALTQTIQVACIPNVACL